MSFLLACLGAIAFVFGIAIVLGLLTEAPPWIAAITGGILVWIFKDDINSRRTGRR